MTLGQLGTFIGGGTPTRSVSKYWNGTIPWISSSDVSEDDIRSISITRFITNEAMLASATKLVPSGSLLFVSRVGTGKVAINADPLCTSQDFTSFVPEKASGEFVGYAFKARPQALQALGQGTSIKGFSKADLEAFALLIPELAEQQKVAAFLSSLDACISAESRKLGALKVHKQSLIQQLFPAEGQRLPSLRFPSFSGEWEEAALGDIAEIKLGKMLDSKKHRTGRLRPYLNNLSVRWNAVDTSNLPTMYFNDEELERFGLRVGDIVVCEGGEPGRSAVWDGRLPDIKFQKAVHRVRFNIPFEPHLLVHFLESMAGTPRLEKLFTGGGIKHLTQETFSKLRMPLASYAEQQSIANCLSSLDSVIGAQSRKVIALQEHKKGLMQGLFPPVVEHAA